MVNIMLLIIRDLSLTFGSNILVRKIHELVYKNNETGCSSEVLENIICQGETANNAAEIRATLREIPSFIKSIRSRRGYKAESKAEVACELNTDWGSIAKAGTLMRGANSPISVGVGNN